MSMPELKSSTYAVSCQYVFNSKCPQRVKPGKQPGTEASCSEEVGPGAYSPVPGVGTIFWQPWIIEPAKMGSVFSSRTQKAAMPRPVTADIDVGGSDFGGAQSFILHLSRALFSHPLALSLLYPHLSDNLYRKVGCAPGSKAFTWPHGERKPPHFHVPFRPYPSLGGEPRGREIGLDTYYDLDRAAFASPVALHSTLGINMYRTSRVYASTFKSKQPGHELRIGSNLDNPLGPGSYNIDRSGIKLKEPSRPSSAFIPYSGGKYKNVGGPRGDGGLWDDEEVEVVPPPRPPRPRTPAKALAKSPSRPKVTPVKK